MDLIELNARDGYLTDVPSDDVGPLLIPFADGTCWCATVTGQKPKEMERHWWARPRPARSGLHYFIPAYARPGVVVEFGVNHRNHQPPRQTNEELLAMTPAVFMSAAVAPTRRRWYGVIRDVSLDDRRNGKLSLLPTEDFMAATKLAPAVEFPIPARELQAFLASVRVGDLGAMLIFADWLEEKRDPRGEALRNSWINFVNDLFPEIPDPERKQAEAPF